MADQRELREAFDNFYQYETKASEAFAANNTKDYIRYSEFMDVWLQKIKSLGGFPDGRR